MNQRWVAMGLAAASAVCLTGCAAMFTGLQEHSNSREGIQEQVAQRERLERGENDQEVLNAQAQRMCKVQVTLSGPVYKLLSDDTKGLPHERWLMKLSNGSTVLIAHDTKLAPRVPLNAGDMVRIHGEYIWNDKGGVIHWTHHAPNGRHEPGWIQYNGRVYE